MNPFAEVGGSYIEQPKTMFSVKMNGQPSEMQSMEAGIPGATEANCRNDLPNRPEYVNEPQYHPEDYPPSTEKRHGQSTD